MKIGFIGAGKVGFSLGKVFSEGGLQVNAIAVTLCAVILILMNLPRLNKLHPIVWIAAGAVVYLKS